jgi:hypothetical protein
MSQNFPEGPVTKVGVWTEIRTHDFPNVKHEITRGPEPWGSIWGYSDTGAHGLCFTAGLGVFWCRVGSIHRLFVLFAYSLVLFNDDTAAQTVSGQRLDSSCSRGLTERHLSHIWLEELKKTTEPLSQDTAPVQFTAVTYVTQSPACLLSHSTKYHTYPVEYYSTYEYHCTNCHSAAIRYPADIWYYEHVWQFTVC